MTQTTWAAPAAEIPLRATVTVSPMPGEGLHVHAPSVADAAVYLAAAAITTGTVVIRNWDEIAAGPSASALREALASMGAYVVRSAEGLTCTSRSTTGHLRGIDIDLSAHPDLIAVILVLALLADDRSEVRGVAEHERLVAALLLDIRGLGGLVDWDGSTVTVFPQPLHGGSWRGAGEPTVLALGAVLALRVPGIQVEGIDLDTPEGALFLETWRRAMLADEHILPGATRGTVPYYH
ncbi:MAG: hypothetical protein QM622_06165 [Microbacterium sp.]